MSTCRSDQHFTHAPERATPVTMPLIAVRTFSAAQTALTFGLALSVLTLTAPPVRAQPTDTGTDDRQGQPLASVAKGITTLSAVIAKPEQSMPDYAGGQVVSGSRIGFLGDKDFLQTPFSTIAYTNKFIADQQAQDIREVIAKTDPTVFASGIAGESLESYSIRGLASDVGDVTVNGLAGMAGYYRSAPEMFERVEVLKGPSALLNGMPPKGSAGGTINLVTKRAGDAPLTRLTGTFMSDSHFGGHIDIGRRFGANKQWGIRFNSLLRNGETSVQGQDKKATQFSLALDWRGQRTRVSADLYRSRDRAYGLTRGLTLASGLPLPKPPKPAVSFNPPWAFYDTTDKGAMLRGEFDLTDNFTAYAAAGISKTELDTNMGLPKLINQSGDFLTNFSGVATKMKRKSAQIGLMGQIQTGSVKHQLAINATYFNEDVDLKGFRNQLPKPWKSNIYDLNWGPESAIPSPVPPINRTGTRLTSFGVADTLCMAQDSVQLMLGARRQKVINDSFNAVTGARIGSRYKASATTPAVAVLFKANDHISVYANYIEGLSQGAIAPNTAANRGEVFAPYKTRQKEMGIKLDLGQFAHTLSTYEIKRPGSYTDPVTNIFSFGGLQRNRGVEWSFFGSPLDGVRLMGGLAFSDPKIKRAAIPGHEGKQATGLPKWQAKLGMEWDVPMMHGLTLMANASSASKQYINADNSLSVPGRTVFDIGARCATKVSGRQLTLRAGVTNLTNKAYWANAHYSALALGAPRTLHLSATMDF